MSLDLQVHFFDRYQMLMLDIGSFDGSDSLPFHARGYEVYAFEPKKDLYQSLYERTKTRTGYTVVNKAVSLVDGEVEFNLCVEGGASSILQFKPDDVLNVHWTPARQDIHSANQSYKVQSTRLDTFLRERGLAGRSIDYIHIDAQGADLDVLKSTGDLIGNVKAGVLETCYSLDKAIYANQTDTLHTVQQWLISNGFIIERVVDNDKTKCECNVYFRRL